MSEKAVSTKATVTEKLEKSKNVACEIKGEYCSKRALSDTSMEKSKEITKEVMKKEVQEAKSTKDDQNDKEKDIKLVEGPGVRITLKEEDPKDIQEVKLEKCEIPKVDSKIHETLKTESAKSVKDEKSANPTKEKIHDKAEEKSTKNDKNDKEIPRNTLEDQVKGIKLVEAPEVHVTLKEEDPEDIQEMKLEKCRLPKVKSTIHEALKIESAKNVEDDKSAISTKKDPEESYEPETSGHRDIKVYPVNLKDLGLKIFAEDSELMELVKGSMTTHSIEEIKKECSRIYMPKFEGLYDFEEKKSTEDANKTKKIPVLTKDSLDSLNLGVRKIWRPLSNPNLDERPLIMTTHLVPSLPIELFEVFAEIIEVVTKKPVVLLYESRSGRPVAKDVTDIAILPAALDWDDGVLLPASFVFEHHLNKNESPRVYVDVIVGNDRASHVENIRDLRGYKCAILSRSNKNCATSLFFNHLYTKGENPTFFGSILDGNSQLEVLQMVANKQADVGVLEAPVIRCHKMNVNGAEFLQILASLGPLPPYRIMINKAQEHTLAKELTTYLLNIKQHKEWMDRLSTFGIVGFAENSIDFYNLDDRKEVPSSVPYY